MDTNNMNKLCFATYTLNRTLFIALLYRKKCNHVEKFGNKYNGASNNHVS